MRARARIYPVAVACNINNLCFFMNKTEAKIRIEKLKKEINRHRYLYHVLDKVEISDAALDSLKHELEELEREYPEFITLDSPTQRIGGKALDKFQKINHVVPQWSFNDAFSAEEIRDFDKRVKKLLIENGEFKDVKPDYVAELKIDGLHVVLTYKNGIFRTGATRGDGKVGENVTQNLKTIDSIPLRLEEKADVIVEGEVFMEKSVLEKLNKDRKKRAEPPLANPRNAAAGAIRQLDPKIAKERRLNCFVYDLSWAGNFSSPKTQSEELKKLGKLGFKVNKNWKYCEDIEQTIKVWEYWMKQKEKEDYWIDGIVIKLNRSDWQKKLGYTGKAPRWAIAFKFPAQQATTIAENIKVQVGRTGALTPVVYLKPVIVAGSKVSKATLHNMDEIERLDIKIGDTVIIQKAGDVIPEVVNVVKGLRTGKEKKFVMPKKCPYCETKVFRPEGEVAYYCPGKNCFAIELRKLSHFASKKAFNIEGLGPNKIKQLAGEGVISDFADIFQLEKGDLEMLERFGEKSADNLINAIEKSKNVTLGKFIYALGIRHIGEEMALDLAGALKSIEKFKNITKEELEQTEGVGPKVAESAYNYFHDKNNLELIGKLFKAGVKIKSEEIKSKKLEGLSFIFTGTLSSMSRNRAKEAVRNLGADIHSSVSKNTSYVVAGENPGSKYEKAKESGVKVIDEKGFLDLIK